MHYVGGTKTFLHFEKAIIDIIEIYKKKSEYKSPKISITRSLNFYAIKNMDIHLITNKDITKIINDYKIYCESNDESNKIDEKIEDDDNLLEIYNNNNYLNEEVINSDCESSNSDECLERKDSSDDDDNDGNDENENLKGKFNINNINLVNKPENQIKVSNNNNPDKNNKKNNNFNDSEKDLLVYQITNKINEIILNENNIIKSFKIESVECLDKFNVTFITRNSFSIFSDIIECDNVKNLKKKISNNTLSFLIFNNYEDFKNKIDVYAHSYKKDFDLKNEIIEFKLKLRKLKLKKILNSKRFNSD